MSDFPVPAYLSDAQRTQSEMKAAMEAWLAATRQIPGAGGSVSTLVIATGSIIPTAGQHLVDTQGGAESDDLTNITQTNLPDGSLLMLRTVSSFKVVVVKHAAGGAGQISIADAADLSLADPSMWLLLRRNGTLWEEVGRFYGSQGFSYRTRYGLPYLPNKRGADVVAATALNFGLDGDYFRVTAGGSAITSLRTMPSGQVIRLAFDASPTLVHSSSLILSGNMNYTPLVGSTMMFVSEGSGVWREQGRTAAKAAGGFYSTPGTYTWSRGTATRVRLTIVAGGGAGGIPGGNGAGGGGGAGAIIEFPVSVASDLTIVVGAGGSTSGASGTSSSVTGTGISLSATGGGGGGSGTGGAYGGPGGGAGTISGGNGGASGISGNPGGGAGCIQSGGGGGGSRVVGNPGSGGNGGGAGLFSGGTYTGEPGGGGGGASAFAPGGNAAVAGIRGSGGGAGAAGGDGFVVVEVIE